MPGSLLRDAVGCLGGTATSTTPTAPTPGGGGAPNADAGHDAACAADPRRAGASAADPRRRRGQGLVELLLLLTLVAILLIGMLSYFGKETSSLMHGIGEDFGAAS